MRDVFIVADNIFSPLGPTTNENFQQLKRGSSGVKQHINTNISAEPFYASLFPDNFFAASNSYTKFEQLLIASITKTLEQIAIDATDKKTILIISSTKGNISLLETENYNANLADRISLNTSAKLLAEHFHFSNQPLMVSHACISGLLAMITAMRLIQSGVYDHAIVAGADVISTFILSGFQSFQAISKSLCKPFDAARDGINLGEAAGTLILSANKKNANDIKIKSGAISNDANHISGPSRTGNELYQAIMQPLSDAEISSDKIDFISAHGTATIYNDEMEAKAISLANMEDVPVNSLKGYYGHTLGAAGIIESIITLQSMRENVIIPTPGFKELGVTKQINVCDVLVEKELNTCLKTASGFGGCNAAVILSKQ